MEELEYVWDLRKFLVKFVKLESLSNLLNLNTFTIVYYQDQDVLNYLDNATLVHSLLLLIILLCNVSIQTLRCWDDMLNMQF